jgi:hypothetical protein
MSQITIGEKKYNVTVNNRALYNIEESFGDKSIMSIMDDLGNGKITLKQIGLIVWNTIKDQIEYEDFVDSILPSQYEAANKVILPLIMGSFNTGSKKK